MHAPETDIQPAESRRHLVDLQYEEFSKTRAEVLNRELVRLRGEGWTVVRAEDHLVATRREEGRSQLERTLIRVAGFLAIGYTATMLLPDVVDSVPGAELAVLGVAALLGGALAFFTRRKAAGERRLNVSVDKHGRPFVDSQRRDF